MKKYISGLAVCVALVACKGEAGNEAEQKSFTIDNDDQKASYAIGLRYGEGFSRDLAELDLEAFRKGMEDGFKGNDPLLTQEELVATLQALQARKMKEQEAKQAEALAANKGEGVAFLEENKKREGVVVTESGLQYEIITEGEGATPGPDDQVEVHYHGTLPDGTVFDSSVDRGEPITFGVSGVIKGWTEALQLMQVGDKWKLYIPSDLAYGERGAGQKIGPNQVLIFDVELLDIVKPEAEAMPDAEKAAE